MLVQANRGHTGLELGYIKNRLSSCVVSQASPILFCSADCFQYWHAEEGSGDLGPLYVDLYRNLNRANEIAEHTIRADFVT